MTVDLMQSAVTVVFISVWAIVGQIMYREARERRRPTRREVHSNRN
jgi:hypothetical protein